MMRKFIFMTIAMTLIFVQPVFAKDVLAEEWVYGMAEDITAEYNICPEVVEAMAMVEASWNAQSVNGPCKGMMQTNINLYPDKITKLSITDIYDPYQAMLLGTDILSDLLDEFDGDIYVALTAYNCGKNSAKVQQVIKGGTHGYADKVLALSYEYERAHGK